MGKVEHMTTHNVNDLPLPLRPACHGPNLMCNAYLGTIVYLHINKPFAALVTIAPPVGPISVDKQELNFTPQADELCFRYKIIES